MAITPPPAPLPNRQQPEAEFVVNADNLVAWFPTFANDANALQADVNAKAATASSAATTATTKADEALVSANAAAASASAASSYADAASTSAGQAAGSAASAADKYDQFDDRYLGSKAVDPTTDNDGGPLMEGALYWNSSAKEMKTWNGSGWVATYLPASAYATLNGTETLTNKTINTANNTLVGIKSVNGESLIGTGDIEIPTGTKTFTASGTISTGQTVSITTDGRVEIVQKAPGEVVGAPVIFERATTNYGSCCYDSANGKVVIAYRDEDNLGYGTAVVGAVSGTSISFGVPVIFESAATTYTSCCYDSANGKVVIAYRDNGNLNYGTAIVGTVSGVSISFGAPVVFESAATFHTSCCYDSANGKVIIAYQDGGNSGYGTAIVGTVSGTSISFGAPIVFESATTAYTSCCYDSANGKTVITYRDEGNANYGTAVVGTVSGTSISFGAPIVFESAAVSHLSCCYDSANGKAVIAYQDGVNANYGTAVVGTVSGTSISFGAPIVFESATTAYTSCCYDSANGKIFIAYQDYGNSSYGTVVVGAVSGTSISFGVPVIFESAATTYTSCCYDSANGKIFIAYRDNGNLNYGTAVVASSVSTTATKFIGISQETVTNAQQVSILLLGGVDTHQSGLATGKTYYLNEDGTLTQANTGYVAGKALSATELLLTGGIV